MINYIVKRSNGKIYANIPNNVILGPNAPTDNLAPLNLVGRDKVGYGQAFNENYIWLAEHFAGETAPKGSITGQIWYNYLSSTGQLLIALKDNARQPDPTNPDTEKDWASIPMISLMNTIPDADASIMGRMVLTNNADSLMVLMKDKEWREIQTSRPTNKELDTLLDINYDLGKSYIAYTQSTASKPVAYFNKGGSSITDENGYTSFQDGQGALHFGSNYFYELKIIGRAVTDNGSVTPLPVPTTYKTWIVRGSFYVDNRGVIIPGTTLPKDLPDPRAIKNLTQIIDVIDQSSDANNWNISVEINGIDPNLPSQGGVTVADYDKYVTASLNSKIHLGFRVQGSIDGLSVGQTVLTQWSVLLKMTGIPPIGV